MSEFKILDHLEKLKADGGKNIDGKDHSFECPACEAPNFKVNVSTGKWNNYSCKCSKVDIREAIEPAYTAETAPTAKQIRPKQNRSWHYFTSVTLKRNQPALTVHRIDNGKGDRRFWQDSLIDGHQAAEVKEKVLPYRLPEALQALKDGAPYIFWVEGESCVDALHALGLFAVTSIGGAGKFKPERDGGHLPGDRLVVVPDADKPGIAHAEAVAAAHPGCQWLYPFPNTPHWNGSMPAKHGLDIADWIQNGATVDQILKGIGPKAEPHPEPAAKLEGVDLQPVNAADIAESVVQSEQAAALTLDPTALIGGELGTALQNRADRLQVPASVLINGLLPVAASQLPIAVRVLLNEDSDFTQPPILWSLSVASTGSNKSETSDLSVKPLYRMQDELPEDQCSRSFFTSSFTLPGLARTQAAQPDRGCLINPDELSGFVRKLQGDQQRGTTDELSRLLSLYDGRPLRGNFSDKSLNYNLKGSSFSLLSTIQPSVLLECMGDLDDASGLWARFNLCEIPIKRRRMTRSGRSGDGLMTQLQAAYLCLQQWDPFTYGLTDEAAELFDCFYDNCEDQRLDQTLQPALQAYAAKQEGRCGRIALVLHCLQAAAQKVPPAHLISGETMLGAITICDFYQQQLKRFYTLALAQVSESLEDQVLLVFDFIKNAAGKPCTIRQINKGPRALRKLTVNQLQQSVDLLTAQNLIRKSPEGWRVMAF